MLSYDPCSCCTPGFGNGRGKLYSATCRHQIADPRNLCHEERRWNCHGIRSLTSASKDEIWVERISSAGKTLAQAEAIVGIAGTFSAGPFLDQGKAPKAGLQNLRVVSHFNDVWQPAEVLAAVGENGKRLPSSALQLYDPEFPNAGGHLKDSRTVRFPPMTKSSIKIGR